MTELEKTPDKLRAVVSAFSKIYEGDDLSFQMLLLSNEDTRSRHSLAQYFEEGPKHPEFASEISRLYSSIAIKAKQARVIGDEQTLNLAVRDAFILSVDDNPYTQRLIGDVVLARLLNPTSPSSQTIISEIDAINDELGVKTTAERLSVESIMTHIFSGKLRITEPIREGGPNFRSV